jgi:hypothetical protein
VRESPAGGVAPAGAPVGAAAKHSDPTIDAIANHRRWDEKSGMENKREPDGSAAGLATTQTHPAVGNRIPKGFGTHEPRTYSFAGFNRAEK